jgi:hypothetical protein
MNGGKGSSSRLADPIIDLIEDYGGVAIIDDFVTHLISLSDVVKNDMRKNLDWDHDTVHSKLWALIESGLDRNGRYRQRPLESLGDRGKKYSPSYIESQCLLTEWLNIYRTIRAYCHISKKKSEAKASA